MIHYESGQMAEVAAAWLKRNWKLDSSNLPEVGLILGTGWGDVLEFDQSSRHPFAAIPGFNKIGQLEGHSREVVCGTLSGKRFVALRGRVHLNERPADPELHVAVRLQIEMLIRLGVKKFILTCAAGSLMKSIGVGDIVLIDGFVTLFAPEMPLFAGEFCSPEDAIDREWAKRIFNTVASDFPLKVASGGHAMVRGPFFEGRKYDKKFLAGTGAAVVGMSVLPEACIASLYPEVKILPLAFITNTAFEEHSHEENQRRAKEKAEHLGTLLGKIVERM